MKATGIVRRIDDLGRVVIPKEIRRTMRIREGDPLEIYTSPEGEVIFRKYSALGEMSENAAQVAEIMQRLAGCAVLVFDRDHVVAVSGTQKREFQERRASQELEELMSRHYLLDVKPKGTAAAFTAALMSVFGEVSFTEIFCPDWKDGTLFLSHMGEYNVALSDPEQKPVMGEKEFTFGNADNPAIVLAPFKPGKATFVSLNPGPDETFSIFAQPGKMLYTPPENQQKGIVTGWFLPDAPLPDFLEAYSRAGGIHHAALIYSETDVTPILSALGTLL